MQDQEKYSASEVQRMASVRLAGIGLAALVAAWSATTFIGWIIGTPILAEIREDWTTMKANTAVALLLSATALLIGRQSKVAGMVCGCGGMIVGLATLFQHRTGINLGIDELIAPGPDEPGGLPGRMSVATATMLTLLGGSAALAAVGRGASFAGLASALAGLGALFGLSGYLFDAALLYEVPGFSTISLPTATCVLLLSVAMIMASPRQGMVALCCADGSAGVLLRRSLPWALVLFVLIQTMSVRSVSHGVLDAPLASALGFVLTLMLGVGLLFIGAKAVRDSDALLNAVVASAVDCIITIDERGEMLTVNAATERLFGYRRSELIGRNISMLMPSPYREGHDGYLKRHQVTGERRIIGIGREVHGLKKGGEVFPIGLSVSEAWVRGRRVYSGIIRDLTERDRQAALLRDNEERFRELSEKTDQGFWFAESRPLRFLYVSPPFEKIWQLNLEALRADANVWQQRIHPDDREHALSIVEPWLRASDGRLDVTYRIIMDDGSIRWVQNRGAHITPGPNGNARIAGTTEDVTQRVEAQQRQRMLLDELDHRVKNNLAAVLSVAQQTLTRCRDLDEFNPAFMGRIEAMARTHSLLAAEKWRGIELRQLVLSTLEPHNSRDGRLEIIGEPQVLPREMAQPLCMALHELATNAAKYGALKHTEGRIRLQWSREGAGKERMLVLHWKETSPARIVPPSTTGFGLRFIEGVIRHELRGSAVLRFDPDGLECRISVPMPPPGEEISMSQPQMAGSEHPHG